MKNLHLNGTRWMSGMLLAFLMLLPAMGFGTDLSIRILSDKSFSRAYFTAELGQYRVYDGDHKPIMEMAAGESLLISIKDGQIDLRKNDELVGVFYNLIFEGKGLKAIFSLQEDSKNAEQKRFYDDHLDVSVDKMVLFFINHVDLENYVAGVVQSEVRSISDQTDFYKVQAIISRTYAMGNLRRHNEEGFDLCDNVHCQVYKCRNNTPIILTATVQSAGKVIVDGKDNLITASFYSNSGGQTANSEDVWNAPVSYLRSVPDTFSLGMKNAVWEKVMPRSEWLSFLNRKYGYDIHNSVMKDSALHFQQPVRKVNFAGGIPLKNIRRDMQLRSTFFSVDTKGNDVILSGRGYGHGVGLSQEGVVRMIDLGYSVREAVEHYYTGVTIKSLEELPAGKLGD
ncbi:MAG: SpoIID/LytB domain-containing protein [Bacteroides sp.]|nr:SpoIID/LytB domain-containing protein [Ruminococcus flavefaciens]MCM1555006.1 SpoIID/LytB domain-containing protein [Bacteroides sp.]